MADTNEDRQLFHFRLFRGLPNGDYVHGETLLDDWLKDELADAYMLATQPEIVPVPEALVFRRGGDGATVCYLHVVTIYAGDGMGDNSSGNVPTDGLVIPKDLREPYLGPFVG